MSKLDDIRVDGGYAVIDLADAPEAKQQIKDLFLELIKSDSDAFNGSDHKDDITDYTDELIVKIEQL